MIKDGRTRARETKVFRWTDTKTLQFYIKNKKLWISTKNKIQRKKIIYFFMQKAYFLIHCVNSHIYALYPNFPA